MSETQKNSGKRGGWWVPAAMIAVGTGLFVAVAADLRYHGALQQLDKPLQQQLPERSTSAGIWLFSEVSYLGDVRAVLGVTVLLGTWLCWKGRTGRRWTLGVMAIGLAGSAVINQALKQIWKIPRPEQWTFHVFEPGSGYSFPSGHTMGAGVMAALVALSVMHHVALPARTRWLAGIAAGALTVLVGFALLYLGVHWLTDVAAAFGVTLAWVGVLRWLLPPAGMSQKWRAV